MKYCKQVAAAGMLTSFNFLILPSP